MVERDRTGTAPHGAFLTMSPLSATARTSMVWP